MASAVDSAIMARDCFVYMYLCMLNTNTHEHRYLYGVSENNGFYSVDCSCTRGAVSTNVSMCAGTLMYVYAMSSRVNFADKCIGIQKTKPMHLYHIEKSGHHGVQ